MVILLEGRKHEKHLKGSFYCMCIHYFFRFIQLVFTLFCIDKPSTSNFLSHSSLIVVFHRHFPLFSLFPFCLLQRMSYIMKVRLDLTVFICVCVCWLRCELGRFDGVTCVCVMLTCDCSFCFTSLIVILLVSCFQWPSLQVCFFPSLFLFPLRCQSPYMCGMVSVMF